MKNSLDQPEGAAIISQKKSILSHIEIGSYDIINKYLCLEVRL